MTKLLIRLFVKEYQDTKNPAVRLVYGKLAGIVGIITNLVLCSLKILVGLIAGSIAIIADGINNLTDMSSSIITLVGFRLSGMPEDEDHPYGHARIEYLTGLIVSVLIIVVGLVLLQSSVGKIMHPTELVVDAWTMGILGFSILVKLWQTFFYMHIANSIDSLTLRATGTDSRNDVVTTSVILAGILVFWFTGINPDGWLGAGVALFIIWSGISLIRETSSPLLGEAPSREMIDGIARIARSHTKVLGIHDLAVHNYGPGKVFASLHVEVDADGDLMESHDMIDNIEYEIRKELGIHCVAHMDPVRISDPVVKQVKGPICQVVERLPGVCEMHDLRVVPGKTHTNIIFDVVLEAGCRCTESEIRQAFEEELHKLDGTYHIVVAFDRAYTKI